MRRARERTRGNHTGKTIRATTTTTRTVSQGCGTFSRARSPTREFHISTDIPIIAHRQIAERAANTTRPSCLAPGRRRALRSRQNPLPK
jgi:hypothetical protein